MKTTIPKLRQTIRRIIKESIPVYAGSKDTPEPRDVKNHLEGYGFECWEDRGHPYPTICELEHPDNDNAYMKVKAHRNHSVGACFIRVEIYQYTEENPKGNHPEYIVGNRQGGQNVESIEEIDELYMKFMDMFVPGYGEGL